MAYLAIQQPEKYGNLCPYVTNSSIEIEDYIRYMREVSWKMTPGIIGISFVHEFTNRISSYARSKGDFSFGSSIRTYSPSSGEEQYVDETAVFIKKSLTNNLPVAMLTYWNSELKFIDVRGTEQTGNTHWMTITKYYRDTQDNRYVAAATWGERVSLNFRACVQSDTFLRPQFISVGWED